MIDCFAELWIDIRTNDFNFFSADDDSDDDDQQLMNELNQNPIVPSNMQEYLVKFVHSFSQDEHFRVFLEKLDDSEKLVLTDFGISVS